MTAQYLALAIVLAVTLNHRNRFVRAAAQCTAAVSLSLRRWERAVARAGAK